MFYSSHTYCLVDWLGYSFYEMERFFSLILPSKSRLPQLCIPPPVASNNRKQSLPISRLNRPIFKSAAPTLHEPPHSFYEPLSQSNEVKAQIEIPPVEKQRVLKIVIMGCANAGKSTLLNYLMERKVWILQLLLFPTLIHL